MKINELLCIYLCLFAVILSSCTVVPIDDEGNLVGLEEAFDAESQVGEIWESKVIPAFQEESVPIEEILSILAKDPQEAREKFGRQAAVGGPYTFMTKGEGNVIGIEASNLLVDLPPFDDKEDIAIKIGPVFTGTEVRDALDFIKFKDYRDVTQYFAIANELNKKVRNEIVNVVDKSTIVGKTISFYGAFGLKEKNDVVVIPVILDIQ